ncbi:MAG: hypothetical protein Unbinned4162contig1001_21 [Prokaryotic dsDNA virus sp.]|nr:MAG: hypothetical protein Unbinned4162contig1001_21 [Prokaryotic dsDNA virus sp.]
MRELIVRTTQNFQTYTLVVNEKEAVIYCESGMQTTPTQFVVTRRSGDADAALKRIHEQYLNNPQMSNDEFRHLVNQHLTRYGWY